MNTSLHKASLVVAIAFSFFVFFSQAYACSCGFGDETVADVFDSTPNVVVLRLASVEKADDGEKTYGVDGIKQSTLTVERVFKGNLKPGQALPFMQGGGADCIWTFSDKDIGSEYLLYLGSKPGKGVLWAGGVCTRSGSTKYRAADLRYLGKIVKMRGKTRISGTLEQEISPAIEGDADDDRLLSKHSIRITGNGKDITLATDENGVYEIYNLLPGKYTLTPEKIYGYKFDRSAKERTDSVIVELKPNKQVEKNFSFSIDNAIQGKLYDANGHPLQGVCIKLLPAQGKPAQYLFELDCTEADGSFNIEDIPVGTYILMINDDGKVTAAAPFETFYYPSTKKLEEAAEFIIGPGDFRRDLVINAPDTAETVTVSGILLYADGKPVPDEFIEFFKDGGSVNQPTLSA
ncbi:MAG: MSCRAMM family protein, partial [Pyrinomonadaceae bacterium]